MLKKIWDRRKAELLFELQSELKVLPCTHEHIHACAYTHGCRRARTLARPPAPTHARTRTRARARTGPCGECWLSCVCRVGDGPAAVCCNILSPMLYMQHPQHHGARCSMLRITWCTIHTSQHPAMLQHPATPHVATSCDCMLQHCMLQHPAILHVAASCNPMSQQNGSLSHGPCRNKRCACSHVARRT